MGCSGSPCYLMAFLALGLGQLVICSVTKVLADSQENVRLDTKAKWLGRELKIAQDNCGFPSATQLFIIFRQVNQELGRRIFNPDLFFFTELQLADISLTPFSLLVARQTTETCWVGM